MYSSGPRVLNFAARATHVLRAGFMALSQAVAGLPGVQERHLHALFRFLDTACTGGLAPDNLADVVYGPLKNDQIVRYAWQVRLESHAVVLPDCCPRQHAA